MIARFFDRIQKALSKALSRMRAAQYRLEREIAEMDRQFRA